MSSKPALLLLPNLLGEHPRHELYLPSSVDRAVAALDGLIAESAGGGRRYLGRFETKKIASQIPVALLNKHTPDADLDFLLEPILAGERWGVVTDAGLPCIADPGAKLVARAKQKGVVVQAFIGPSAILLALMQSGIAGQKFCFHGYLSKDNWIREKQLAEMERNEGAQIFIEAPHRNQQTLEHLISILDPKTRLCVAVDLTLPGQIVLTQTIAVWRTFPLPNLHKRTATFVLSHEKDKI